MLRFSGLDLELVRKHVGCFRDDPGDRDLPLEVTDDETVRGDLKSCLQACGQRHYM